MALGPTGPGWLDPAAAAQRRLETVGERAQAVPGAPSARRQSRRDQGHRRQLARHLAYEPHPGHEPSPLEPLLLILGTSAIGVSAERLTSRTAVYGPVRKVVWEGWE